VGVWRGLIHADLLDVGARFFYGIELRNRVEGDDVEVTGLLFCDVGGWVWGGAEAEFE
jgi:hypothetical protein